MAISPSPHTHTILQCHHVIRINIIMLGLSFSTDTINMVSHHFRHSKLGVGIITTLYCYQSLIYMSINVVNNNTEYVTIIIITQISLSLRFIMFSNTYLDIIPLLCFIARHTNSGARRHWQVPVAARSGMCTAWRRHATHWVISASTSRHNNSVDHTEWSSMAESLLVINVSHELIPHGNAQLTRLP